MDTRSHYDKYTFTLINIMHIFLNVLIQILSMYEDVAFNIGKCKRMLATAAQYSQPSTTENIMVIFVAYFSGEQNF